MKPHAPLHWFNISNAAGTAAEISIYGPIGAEYEGGTGSRAFVEELNKVTAKNITLRIHSPGGNIFEGHAIFNALQRHPATVTTIVDGLAASMATVVALAGSRVKIAANGIWMIHDTAGVTAGTAKDMRDTAGILEKLSAQILDVYAAKTGKPREEIAALMAAETWMNAEEAKAFGFVDEIIPALKAAAAVAGDFDLSAFAHPPAAPSNRLKAIFDEYTAHRAERRHAQAAALLHEHESELTIYAEQLEASNAPRNVEMIHAELAVHQQAIISLRATVAEKDAKIVALVGQAKSADLRAQEIAAAHGSLPAGKDGTELAGHGASESALWIKYAAASPQVQAEIRATQYDALTKSAAAYDARRVAAPSS